MAFEIGHLPYGGAIKGRLKGQKPWNVGTSIWIECKCLKCSKDFKIRQCHIGRDRGKYCSKECFYEAITIYSLSPGERFTHQFRKLDEYKTWHMNCLKRDWFKCQECNSKDNLEVHHIESFTELVIEFLQKYNQFSPVDDKETLIRLAITHEPFWDISNGQTLCESHHKSLRKILWQ